MRESNRIDENTSEASQLFRDYRKKFEELKGQPIIWRTSNNPNLKNPQLVLVEQPFQYFVLVQKTVYNVEAQATVLRYAVNYASLYAGHDTVETLEMKPI